MAVDATLALLSHILEALVVSCWLLWDHRLPAIYKLGSIIAGAASCNKLLRRCLQCYSSQVSTACRCSTLVLYGVRLQC